MKGTEVVNVIDLHLFANDSHSSILNLNNIKCELTQTEDMDMTGVPNSINSIPTKDAFNSAVLMENSKEAQPSRNNSRLNSGKRNSIKNEETREERARRKAMIKQFKLSMRHLIQRPHQQDNKI